MPNGFYEIPEFYGRGMEEVLEIQKRFNVLQNAIIPQLKTGEGIPLHIRECDKCKLVKPCLQGTRHDGGSITEIFECPECFDRVKTEYEVGLILAGCKTTSELMEERINVLSDS